VTIPILRRRALTILLAGLGTLAGSTSADAARGHARLPDDGRGRTASGRVLARASATTFGGPIAARATAPWRRLVDEIGPAWGRWDGTDPVPRQIVTTGVAADGATASAREAERFGAAFLARHLDLLAPGASIADFRLVTNDLSHGVRTLGWVQEHRGRVVIDGQLSLRIANDRLVAIASSAWPDLAVAEAAPRISDLDATAAAEAWLAADVPGVVTAHRVVGPVVLPMPEAHGVVAHEAMEVHASGDAPRSEWIVWVDSATGAPLARKQTLHYATGGLLYDVPVRGPLGDRVFLPAPNTNVIVDGAPQLTSPQGEVAFPGASATIVTGLSGPFVSVSNAMGEVASADLLVTDGTQALWSAPDDEMVDAQLSAFVHAALVKEFVRGIAPDLAWLDDQIPVTVNIDDECNAFSDGNSINFFRASGSCENTGRLADVVYHEFGHSVHHQSVLPGVGSFDVALSEGTSDYLSAAITGDPALARGFFFDDSPLRHLDPEGEEYRWPEDNGEVHAAGLIIGGALWDLRKILIAKHGEALGIQLTDRIWYEATRRAHDIPSMYIETLVVDDDDGDLSNGTPNVCEIGAAYGPHGLFSPGEAGEQVVHTSTPDGEQIDLLVSLPSFPGCPVDAEATLEWRLRDTPEIVETLPMQPARGGFTAMLPQVPAGSVLQYRVIAAYSNGAERSLPENLGDPWYELFIGEVVPIWCTSFQDEAPDWTLSGQFRAGPTLGQSAVDPGAPWGGDPIVLGVALDGIGEYAPWETSTAQSPSIAIPPGYASVRLQYRRWLTVEDGFFDQAWIDADGDPVWSNYASEIEELANVHHRDREWRFHDVDVTAAAADGTLQLELGLSSDGGLQLGGWTVDEMCVVGFDAAAATCGNGIMEAGEACDDGNSEPGDGCDACVPTGGGSGGGGGDEDPDTGTGGDSDGADPDGDGEPGLDGDGLVDRGCVCATTSTRDPFSAAFWLLALFVRPRRFVSRIRAAREQRPGTDPDLHAKDQRHDDSRRARRDRGIRRDGPRRIGARRSSAVRH
jgi:cysteine-rich repeat protein